MFEIFYFILGIVNNFFLIAIFLFAKFSKISILKGLGIAYIWLVFPSTYAIFIAQQLHKPVQYSIFLGIFIAFLLLEGLYEYILKLPFRKNWKLLTPYLMLYWSMNYGFVVMAWKNSVYQGSVILGLFIIQLVANLASHVKKEQT
jgi:hypothetical protein